MRIRDFAFSGVAAVAIGAAGVSTAEAALVYYTADLNQLNDSNVSGNAVLIHDTEANTLTVEISAFNAEPGKTHMMHIHGLSAAGVPIDSTEPPPAADTDLDGYIEVGEGAAFYGPVILPLDDDGSFPTAPQGIINFAETYDLTDSGTFAGSFDQSDLFPLPFRTIVIHGKTVATGEGAGTEGEVNGTGGYKTALPVAVGEIVGIIPEPGSAAMLGLAGLGLLARRRR